MVNKPIALFSEDFPPCSGGIAQWTLGIAEQLTQWYTPVVVYTKKRRDRARYEGARLILVSMRGRDWKRYHRIYTKYYSRRLLKSHPVAAIITSTWNLAEGIWGFKRKYNFTLVPVLHGLEVTRSYPPKVIKRMERTLAHCDFAVAVSNFTRQKTLERVSIDAEHIKVLPNGVDTCKFHPIADIGDCRRALGIHADAKVLLTLSRVVERKGHDAVLRSLPKILKEYPTAVYVIAGPWRQWVYNELQAVISDHNLADHVIFTGRIDDDKMAYIYNIADVYIMVSRVLEAQGDVEGFGITFLEANACEKPVIGSHSGGIPEAVLDGETGLLVDPLDTDQIAEAVIRLFGNPEMARRLGINGRRRIERELTWEIITRRLVHLLEERSMDSTGGAM